jgi:hypothetical protein
MFGELSKTAGTGTLASTFPETLTLNPLQVFEELVLARGCLYVTETQTGRIYSIYLGRSYHPAPSPNPDQRGKVMTS